MRIDELVTSYPRLYHMAEDGSWSTIQRHGLLSTRALLDLFEVNGSERERLYSQHRPDCVTVEHPQHGTAVIRDQKPMPPSRLQSCLKDGISPRQWYELINDRVFFWLSEARLIRLLSARAYRRRPHTVLHIGTAALVRDYADSIKLTGMNSGNTLPVAFPRGQNTFCSIESYPFMEMRKKRRLSDAVVELSVESGVPNITDYVLKVERRHGTDLLENLV